MIAAEIRNNETWFAAARLAAYKARLLSKELKVSPRQLRRYSRQLFGCSPQHWLNQQRLLLAMPLLRQRRLVKTVAFDLGFKRVSHFSRQFKHRFGLSPTGYLRWIDRQTVGPV